MSRSDSLRILTIHSGKPIVSNVHSRKLKSIFVINILLLLYGDDKKALVLFALSLFHMITATYGRFIIFYILSMEEPMTSIILLYFIPTVIDKSIILTSTDTCRVTTAFEMLELYAGKLARTVLWGPGGRKTSRLPDHFALA